MISGDLYHRMCFKGKISIDEYWLCLSELKFARYSDFVRLFRANILHKVNSPLIFIIPVYTFSTVHMVAVEYKPFFQLNSGLDIGGYMDGYH